jgi:transposase InsO family protein
MDTFKKFKLAFEKENRRNIKALCTNNGGEYTSYAFSKLCIASSIKRELSQSYMPQQIDIIYKMEKQITTRQS